jgi:hypothetical protein
MIEFDLTPAPIEFHLNAEVPEPSDNARLLEDGDFRLLEDEDFRLLE